MNQLFCQYRTKSLAHGDKTETRLTKSLCIVRHKNSHTSNARCLKIWTRGRYFNILNICAGNLPDIAGFGEKTKETKENSGRLFRNSGRIFCAHGVNSVRKKHVTYLGKRVLHMAMAHTFNTFYTLHHGGC